jgi:hypothetical protein
MTMYPMSGTPRTTEPAVYGRVAGGMNPNSNCLRLESRFRPCRHRKSVYRVLCGQFCIRGARQNSSERECYHTLDSTAVQSSVHGFASTDEVDAAVSHKNQNGSLDTGRAQGPLKCSIVVLVRKLGNKLVVGSLRVVARTQATCPPHRSTILTPAAIE